LSLKHRYCLDELQDELPPAWTVDVTDNFQCAAAAAAAAGGGGGGNRQLGLRRLVVDLD
jgi:hypothetical protein